MAFHWSESTYASGSWASRIHLPKSLMYENHERQPPGFASIVLLQFFLSNFCTIFPQHGLPVSSRNCTI